MTRIRFEGPNRASALLLLLVVLALTDIHGHARAEIEFYQDDGPKLPNVNVQRLMRYLESKRHQGSQHQQQQQQQPRLYTRSGSDSLDQLERLAHIEAERAREERLEQQHQELLTQKLQQHLQQLARQKQRGLLRDDLPERPDVLDMLQSRQPVDSLAYVHELDRQSLLPYLGLEYEPYSDEQRQRQEEEEEEREEARARLLQAPSIKNPLLDYPETHYEDVARPRGHHQQQQQQQRQHIEAINQHRGEEHRHRPDRPLVPFTYSAPKLQYEPNGPSPFAVRPNDPRYFQNNDDDDVEASNQRAPSQQDQRHHHNEAVKHNKQQQQHQQQPVVPASEHVHEQEQHQQQQQQHQVPVERMSTPKPKQNNLSRDKEVEQENENDQDNDDEELNMLPEPRRRAERDPLVVSLDYKNTNDVYYIAAVAGCSAASVFALVLITLTWWRLHRVSKAAADVDYPAYGVTGPNKDMSPSGDQRLAQSAQMYHFQHQKQQIIAMEKASATRDPGSVSEAESDEENEEGDYTVYECPGLAPTAEMEVTNPLFDDPTPLKQGSQSSERNGNV